MWVVTDELLSYDDGKTFLSITPGGLTVALIDYSFFHYCRAELGRDSSAVVVCPPPVQERRRHRAGGLCQGGPGAGHSEEGYGGLRVPPERRLHQPGPGKTNPHDSPPS